MSLRSTLSLQSTGRANAGRSAALLFAVAVVSASCTGTTHRTQTPTPPVIGQPAAVTVAVGQPAPAGTGQLSAVSCATLARCWAVGVPGPNAPATTPGHAAPPVTVIVATKDAGATWSAQSTSLTAAPALTGISCPSVKFCMAVGATVASPSTGVVLTTENRGATWTSASVPSGAISVNAVQCASATSCTALASDGSSLWSALTQDGGGTWTRQGALPAGFGGALTLTCQPGGTCLVAGFTPTSTGHGQGAVAISTDAGATWASATVPAGIGLLQSVACVTPTNCLAAGTTSTTLSDVVPAKGLVLHSANGGHTWTTATRTPPIDDVFALACPTSTTCAMVGTKWTGTPTIATGAVAESVNAGVTFTRSPTAYTPLTLTALDCPDMRHCIAVGANTVARLTLPAPRAKPSS